MHKSPLLHFFTYSLLLLELFVLLGKLWWFFELFTHYPLYYAIFAAILLVLALLFRHFKLALIVSVLLSLSLGTLAPYLNRTPSFLNTATSFQEADLTVLSNNFYFLNDNFKEIQDLLIEENPEIFVIQEAGVQWKEALPLFQENYPYLSMTWKTGVQGMVIGSKIQGSFQEISLGSYFGLEFMPQDQSFRLLVVHPPAPLNLAWAKERNAQFEDLSTYARQSLLPTLVIGDFNSTPWSPFFQKLLKKSGLTDARIGFGLVPSWHANNPLFRLPIDHVLIKGGFQAVNFYTTRALSSDHWPIVVKLKFSD